MRVRAASDFTTDTGRVVLAGTEFEASAAELERGGHLLERLNVADPETVVDAGPDPADYEGGAAGDEDDADDLADDVAHGEGSGMDRADPDGEGDPGDLEGDGS